MMQASLPRNTTRNLPEYEDDNFKIPSVSGMPGGNPTLQRLYTNQLNQAQNYARNIKGSGDAVYNSYASQARSQLPGLIQKNREAYNSRGLLKSGKEAEGEASTVQGIKTDLAQKRAEINRQMQDNLNQMEGNAFNTAGLLAAPSAQTAGTDLDRISTDLGVNSSNNMLNAQLIGSILGGASSLGAGYLSDNNLMNRRSSAPSTMISRGYGDYNPGPSFGGRGY